MERFLEIIQKLVDQIEANLEADVNIVDLAATFGISPFHFQRLFKALVGDPLGSYIRGRRLTRAAELILESDTGLLDIALSVGFNSHEAFTRSFKAQFGQTPKEFRSNRPAVVLRKKPLLTMDLFAHIKKDLQREPQVLTLERRIVIGIKSTVHSPFVLEEDFCAEADQTWMKLAGRFAEIKNSVPGTFFGITISPSGHFTEEQIEFLAGMSVTELEGLPNGMTQYELPAGKFAFFEHQDPSDNRYKETIDYIYGYWLPNSNYTRGQGVDYVFVENMHEFGKPGFTVKYAIPVVAR